MDNNDKPKYNLDHPPWFLSVPTEEETKLFNKSLSKAVLNDFFAQLRKNPTIPHSGVIAPNLGGITAGEMALVYLRTQNLTRQRRKKLKMMTEPETPLPPKQKPCPLWAVLYSQEPRHSGV